MPYVVARPPEFRVHSTEGLLAGRRVLVVEDDYFIAVDVARALERAGVKVLGPVPDVERALALIDDGAQLDAAILDINLGDHETVYPVAARLQEMEVPFVFVTGNVRVAVEATFSQRPRLAKPVLGRDLLRAVEQLLAR